MNSGAKTPEQAQGVRPQFHVRYARELFEALESRDGAIRLAALEVV
jgi:hypothetical protein